MMPGCKHHDVRTTLTLDADVADLLKRESRNKEESFKQTVNRCLRQGLTSGEKMTKRKAFKVEPFDMPLSPGFNLDKPWSIIEELEGPSHR